MRSGEEDSEGPVIRDRRRIDPATGQVRDSGGQYADDRSQPGPARPRPGKHAASQPGHAAPQPDYPPPPADYPAGAGNSGHGTAGDPGGAPAGPADPGPAPAGDRGGRDFADALAERTADLQRLQAEYANYRKRVERDRQAVREQALASVLTELLPVLDDIGRAREHNELTGGFKSVAESLESAASKLGLGMYGEDGDPFDPRLHEALMHSYSPDVTETTCERILQPGYKVGDRILRPARVAVAEPASEPEPGAGRSEPDQTAGEGYAGPAGGGPFTGGPDGTG